MNLPSNPNVRFQHRLQSTQRRSPPSTSPSRKCTHIISAGRQHVRFIHGDEPRGWRDTPFRQFPVQNLPKFSFKLTKNDWGPLIQPWISPQPLGSCEMAKSNQRLQMAFPKSGDHVYIPIQSGLLKAAQGCIWLNPRPVHSQPIPSKSHHLRTIKILLITVPEIDRSTRSRNLSRPLPSCPIILGLPFPIISSLMLISTGGHSPEKLLSPPTGCHRFRTCSAISSC